MGPSYSGVAQWQSRRLLTAGSGVRNPPPEHPRRRRRRPRPITWTQIWPVFERYGQAVVPAGAGRTFNIAGRRLETEHPRSRARIGATRGRVLPLSLIHISE